MEICFPSTVGDKDDSTKYKQTKRFCEVQAIILAHYSTYDIHPLLQNDTSGKEKAKFLLPFANRPIITYPLHLLEIHGFTEILVVVTDDFAEDMMNFLATYKHYADDEQYLYNITPVTVNEEDLGEIQVLKQIHPHIKTDFLVIRCDIFTNAPLGELLRIHRRENSSITLLLSKETQSQQTTNKHKQSKKKKKSKNTHIIGTDLAHHQQLVLNGHPKEIERLWYMKARADLEDEETQSNKHKNNDEAQLTLDKQLLDYIPHLRLTTKFKIQQIGIFCRWILLWILEDAPSEYELLYEEAVPHLIDMQTEINYMQTAINDINLFATDEIQSNATNDSNPNININKQNVFDFPDLMRRSSNQNYQELKLPQDDLQPTQDTKMNKSAAKVVRQASRYASGIFLSHVDVLGDVYMKSTTANTSNSSLPRNLMMKNMNNYKKEDTLRGFDDAKSDITAISISAMSTAVNAPNSPRTNVCNEEQEEALQLQRKTSPLNQRIKNLPSPQHLATVDDLPKITQQFLHNQDDKSRYMSRVKNASQDKLKIFGYVYGVNNDNGLFSCIIKNSECFLSLSMSLINSVMCFEKRLEQKEKEKQRQQQHSANNRGARKRRRDTVQEIGNEEREEYFTMKDKEDNGLLYLILDGNKLEDCRMQNGESNIKNGCILSPNCIVGDKTRIDKCILGSFVNIGKNCKIINCVIFNHVTIGDNCKISNSIISTHTNIADKANIHNCKIAERANISKGSNLKNETLQLQFGAATAAIDDYFNNDDANNNNNNDDDDVINID